MSLLLNSKFKINFFYLFFRYYFHSFFSKKKKKSGIVNSLAIDDGLRRLYIGGEFDSAGEFSSTNLAYYSITSNSYFPMGTNSDGVVNALAVNQSSHELVIGGSFSMLDGVACLFIGVWNGSNYKPLSFGVSDDVNALAFDSSSKILYVGGKFSVAGTNVVVNGIAQFSNGQWASLGGNVGANGEILTVYVDYRNWLWIGGSQSRLNGVNCSLCVWKPSTSTWFGTATLEDSFVKTITVNATNNHTIIGGNFNYQGYHMAEWDGQNLVPILVADGPDFEVNSIVMNPTNSIYYVGGSFSYVAQERMDTVASFNGSGWSRLGLGFPYGVVNTIALDPTTGKPFFGGNFQSILGESCASSLATIHGSGPVSTPPPSNYSEFPSNWTAYPSHWEVVGFNAMVYNESSNEIILAGMEDSPLWDGSGFNSSIYIVNSQTGNVTKTFGFGAQTRNLKIWNQTYIAVSFGLVVRQWNESAFAWQRISQSVFGVMASIENPVFPSFQELEEDNDHNLIVGV